MDTNFEREALQDLLGSDGWSVFTKAVWERWGGKGYFARIDQAMKINDMEKVKLIHNLSTEVRAMLSWPQMRVNEIEADKK